MLDLPRLVRGAAVPNLMPGAFFFTPSAAMTQGLGEEGAGAWWQARELSVPTTTW